MNQIRKTVIFGPFIGEFGWELLYWQGIVRRLCNGFFKDHHKVGVAREGRRAFYPEVDEFRAIPSELFPPGYSARGYYCDGWSNGLPGAAGDTRYLDIRNLKKIFKGQKISKISKTIKWPGPSIEPIFSLYCDSLVKTYGHDTTIVSPFKLHTYDGVTFGVDLEVKPSLLESRTSITPQFSEQYLTHLKPHDSWANEWVEKLDVTPNKLIAIFPRHRAFRRNDKNWAESEYLKLISLLQNFGYTVALLGEPDGAYFSKKTPPGCLNLIDLPPAVRLDCQLALLKRSKCAVGAMSGSLLVALACGTPTVIFGDSSYASRYYKENFMNTPLNYVGLMNPNVNDLWRILQNFIGAISPQY